MKGKRRRDGETTREEKEERRQDERDSDTHRTHTPHAPHNTAQHREGLRDKILS